MRIIAGKYGSLRLKTLSGNKTRPTSDRVRESFFSRIGPDFTHHSVLDLFAGSGSIGFEALSRGAAFVVFNDNNHQVVEVLKQNAQHLNLASEHFRILKSDCLKALEQCRKKGYFFDWVYLDPPYSFLEMEEVFEGLLSVLKPLGLVYYEKEHDTEDKVYSGYLLRDVYRYSRTKITVYQQADSRSIIE